MLLSLSWKYSNRRRFILLKAQHGKNYVSFPAFRLVFIFSVCRKSWSWVLSYRQTLPDLCGARNLSFGKLHVVYCFCCQFMGFCVLFGVIHSGYSTEAYSHSMFQSSGVCWASDKMVLFSKSTVGKQRRREGLCRTGFCEFSSKLKTAVCCTILVWKLRVKVMHRCGTRDFLKSR
jgi:hypothetical protein